MGGMTIMQFALDHPELFGTRVRGVALLSTSPGGLRDVSLGLPALAARPLHRLLPVTAAVLVRNADLIEMGRSRVNDLSLLFTRLYSFGSTASPALADFTHRMIGETTIDIISEFLPTLQRHQRQAALHTLATVPALVMVGQEDRMTPAQHSLDMARRLPRAELEIIADSGHMMILEHYAQVNHQLRLLVARVRADLAEDRDAAEQDLAPAAPASGRRGDRLAPRRAGWCASAGTPSRCARSAQIWPPVCPPGTCSCSTARSARARRRSRRGSVRRCPCAGP